MATYSFLSIQASIAGPGGIFALGNGAGVAEEGISVTMEGDKDVMTTGADGSVMHALAARMSGSVVVRLLKTSPTNSLLSALYNAQTATPALHGLNTIVVRDKDRGDIVSCNLCAFKKHPQVSYSMQGPPMMEWEFNAGQIFPLLGTGLPDA